MGIFDLFLLFSYEGGEEICMCGWMDGCKEVVLRIKYKILCLNLIVE